MLFASSTQLVLKISEDSQISPTFFLIILVKTRYLQLKIQSFDPFCCCVFYLERKLFYKQKQPKYFPREFHFCILFLNVEKEKKITRMMLYIFETKTFRSSTFKNEKKKIMTQNGALFFMRDSYFKISSSIRVADWHFMNICVYY